jgi:F0F1-type ATP synthase assembly protein I
MGTLLKIFASGTVIFGTGFGNIEDYIFFFALFVFWLLCFGQGCFILVRLLTLVARVELYIWKCPA